MEIDSYQEKQTTAISTLLRAVGGWSRPSGRGLFMFHLLLHSATSATITGIAFATLGGAFFGCGILGFTLGSCLGYCGGAIAYYRSTAAASLLALEEQPRLLHLHLMRSFTGAGWHRECLEGESGKVEGKWLDRFRSSFRLQGMLMGAWMAATPALVEIDEQREKIMIAKAVESI